MHLYNIDIDECGEEIDHCDETGPAPAQCINTDGGYTCSCDIHSGYKLSQNNQTCEGIVDICKKEKDGTVIMQFLKSQM